MNDDFWKRFFAFAGIFNLLVGIVLLLSPSLITHVFPLPLPATDWLFPRVFGACVAAFGVGYLMVASDLDRHRGLIWIGVIGKSLFFLVMLIYWIKGTIGFWAFTGGVLDFIFAMFFLRFLTRYPAR